MQIAKRLLSLVLALLMAFTLVACTEDPVDTNTNSGSDSAQGSDTDSEITSTSSEEEEFDPGERPYDETKGKTFIILQHQSEENPFYYSQDSLMGEKVAERIEELEKAYGVTFAYTQVPASTLLGNVLLQMNITGAGGDLCFSNENGRLRLGAGTGGETSLFVDLLTVDHIINFWDMEKWGNITARETMMAGGTFYGVTPALWIDCTPLPYYVMVYNRDMLKHYQAPDPQEAWEKNQWDRDVMLEAITSVYDDSTSETVYGITAWNMHYIRATILSTGCQLVNVDKINADGSVDWHNGWDSPDVEEALSWLRNSVNANSKYFNDGNWGGFGGWNSYQKLLSQSCAFTLTRPRELFANIAVEAEFDFGLTTWAGAEPNILSGYYEDCYSAAIPVFASKAEHSAYIMWDLFEGLNGVEQNDDIIKYYRDTYFTSDLDVTYLLRDGANLMYSYWPNGIDSVINTLNGSLFSPQSVKNIMEKAIHVADKDIETHVVPNAVALNQYKEQGYFD